jgi:hypothetical protein
MRSINTQNDNFDYNLVELCDVMIIKSEYVEQKKYFFVIYETSLNF